MEWLRLEVWKNDNLLFVREKPSFAKNEKARRSAHTRLMNWAEREFPESTSRSIEVVERPIPKGLN